MIRALALAAITVAVAGCHRNKQEEAICATATQLRAGAPGFKERDCGDDWCALAIGPPGTIVKCDGLRVLNPGEGPASQVPGTVIVMPLEDGGALVDLDIWVERENDHYGAEVLKVKFPGSVINPLAEPFSPKALEFVSKRCKP